MSFASTADTRIPKISYQSSFPIADPTESTSSPEIKVRYSPPPTSTRVPKAATIIAVNSVKHWAEGAREWRALLAAPLLAALP